MSRFHQHEWDLLPEQAFRPRAGRYGGMTLEGGKGGSSAPPPDPRLIEAQIRSMGIQDNVIQQVVANANSLMPLQREQMELGLKSASAAYDQSQQDRAFALSRRGMLAGLQDRIASDANNFNEGQRTADLRAQGMADVSAATSAARNSAMRDFARRGMDPSKVADAFARQGTSQAAAAAQAGFMARNAARQEGLQLTDRANNALAGYPAMASGLSSSGAGFGGLGLGYANAGLAGMNSGLNSAGAMAGSMGQNAAGMYNAMGNYKNGQDQIAASSDPFNTILGAATGIGTAWGLKTFGSDRRLKEDIKYVGRDEKTQLNLYEFSYIGDSNARRFRGVMADEVEARYPTAVHYDDFGFASVDYGSLGIEMVEV